MPFIQLWKAISLSDRDRKWYHTFPFQLLASLAQKLNDCAPQQKLN